jgi:CBS domain-containing protein
MLIKDVMKKNVQIVHPDMKITHAAKIMSKHHTESLIIQDKKGNITGILTDKDILTDVVAKKKSLKQIQAKNIMTKNIITISPDQKIEQAVKLMKEKKIDKIPVMERGKIIGMVTAKDLISAQNEMTRKLKNLLSIETKTYSFKLKKSFFIILKEKLNTIFGSFQIFLGMVSMLSVYLFLNKVEFIEPILPSEILRTSVFAILSIIGGFSLISGIFLLSLES